jgi:Protein of unknown function (DUF3108)
VILRGLTGATGFLVAFATVLMDSGWSLAHAQAKLDAAYEATLVGIPIGNVSWTIDLAENRFKAAASGETAGLLRVFSNDYGSAMAHGVVSAGRPVASNYALKLVAGKWTDDVQISYSGGKATEHVPDPPAKPNPNQVPLTDASRKGAVDPMTALLIRVPGSGDTAAPEACEPSIAVFDGHTRYDLRLAFVRLDEVKADTGYQGPVVVCSVKFVPVAGYNPQRFIVSYLAEQRDMEIWLAPIAGSRLVVPYRISIRTPVGLGVLQAVRFVTLPEHSPANDLN